MIRTAKRLISYILIIVMVIMLFCVFMQFFLRYVFNTSFQVVEELSNFTLTVITFLGAAAIFFEERHIKIRFLLDLAPKKIQKILSFVANLLVVLFLVIFTVKSAQLSYLVKRQVSVFLHISKFYMYIPMTISGFLMLIYQIKKFKNMFTEKLGRQE